MYIENKLKKQLELQSDINPDKHDGSYEMMRLTIDAYSNLSNLSVCSYEDMDLLMFVFSLGFTLPTKITKLDNSHLSLSDKARLKKEYDRIYQHSNKGQYETENGKVGMFNSGFSTFNKGNPWKNGEAERIIRMLIAIKLLDDIKDVDQIYRICENALSTPVNTLGAKTMSAILHTYKPNAFPIFIGGGYAVYDKLNLGLNNLDDLTQYINNCRIINKAFKGKKKYNFNNYRVIDLLKPEIDYICMLDYIKKFKTQRYFDPTHARMGTVRTPAQVANNAELKLKGQMSFWELKAFAEKCKITKNLDSSEVSTWINQGQYVDKYSWVQLKYSQFKNSPISISLFIEEDGSNETRLKVCLEIKNAKKGLSTSAVFPQYHKHLNCPLPRGFVYTNGSNEDSVPTTINDTVPQILQKIKSGTYTKIQPSIIIKRPPNEKNADYDQQVFDAIDQLIPIYEYVMGLTTKVPLLSSSPQTAIAGGNLNMSKYDNIELNTILYGPPGTGKTYETAKYAVAICDGASNLPADYSDIMKRYNELKNAGRIAFTTFHQSYGYEEFIEGIKPVVDDSQDVGYTVESGVFKRFCERADKTSTIIKNVKINSGAKVWKIFLGGTGSTALKNSCYMDNTIRIGWKDDPEIITDDTPGLTKQEIRMLMDFQDEMNIGDIVLIGKSQKAVDGIAVITGDYEFDRSNLEWPRKRNVKWLFRNIDIDVLDLNDGKGLGRNTVSRLKRLSGEKIQQIIDSIEKEDNEEVVETVIDENNEVVPYVFIIDEINRGNISKIFGELITLIEDTKRKGMTEAMKATLPYSGEEFSVPSNVYILGTMNTADRSIALMDTALRRRFSFIEMMPDSEVLTGLGADKISDNGNDIDIKAMLDAINARIEYLYDREHTIGHAFFTGLGQNSTVADLAEIFEKKVIPLLQEYFYEDYQKIQFVLGDNAKTNDDLKFIKDEALDPAAVFKGQTDELDLPEVKYSINKDALNNAESYIQIY